MRKLFGTDGVRGVANEYPMTVEVAMNLGRAVAKICKRGGHRHRVVIGKDTRLSGYMFEQAIASGICSMGVDVMLVGPMPTPGISFITQSMRADAGIVISASHNPFHDNGIKVFSHDGFKLPDEEEERIEETILRPDVAGLLPVAKEIGKAFRIDDALGRYVQHLKETFPKDRRLDGLKVVIDCAHGAAYKVAPEVFSELGATVFAEGVDPDGLNINDARGAMHPGHTCEQVKKRGADFGIALDGDADRVILSDEKGCAVDGDHVMAFCGLDMQEKGELKKKTVVSTIMSNMGLELALKKGGVRLVRTGVGDRYVVDEMRRHGCNFGGEQSGHLIFLDYATTGDGVIAALRAAALMIEKGKKLSELAATMETFPQVLCSFKVREKRPLDKMPAVKRRMADVEKALKGMGRVNVRYSGTEMKARVMVEGQDETRVKKYADEIAALISKEVGA
ncbi:MAG: phosphoglucosamine mutase [Deltaproteobacteria bacterium]|nr:phosphoglucosamine mutase [Deltaproteobacteria bacterium]